MDNNNLALIPLGEAARMMEETEETEINRSTDWNNMHTEYLI